MSIKPHHSTIAASHSEATAVVCNKRLLSAGHPWLVNMGDDLVQHQVHEAVHAVKAADVMFWDTLVRTSGFVPGQLQDTTSLFTANGNRNEATTNLDFGVTAERSAEANWVNSGNPLLPLGSEAILSQSDRLDCSIVDRQVQRSEHRASSSLKLISAQPSGVTRGEDMIHASGKPLELTCINGATLPSDQSHVVLALRVFTWFRNPILRRPGAGAQPPNTVSQNGDYSNLEPWITGDCNGNAPGTVEDVYRLHWQVEEQLHWSFGGISGHRRTAGQLAVETLGEFGEPPAGHWCRSEAIPSRADGSERALSACTSEGVETSCRGFASDKAAKRTQPDAKRSIGEEIVHSIAKAIGRNDGPEELDRQHAHVVLPDRRSNFRPPCGVSCKGKTTGEFGEPPAPQSIAECEAIPSRSDQSERTMSACRSAGVQTSSRGLASDKAAKRTRPCDAIAGEEIVGAGAKALDELGHQRRHGRHDRPDPLAELRMGRPHGHLASREAQAKLIWMGNRARARHPDSAAFHGAAYLATDSANHTNAKEQQNILCTAKIFAIPVGAESTAFGLVQAPGRNMLSLRDNLNACDGIQKVVTFLFTDRSSDSMKVGVTQRSKKTADQSSTFDGYAVQPGRAVVGNDDCMPRAEPAVGSKPTSYEERLASLKQANPVVNPRDERGEPRETWCSSPTAWWRGQDAGVAHSGQRRVRLNGGYAAERQHQAPRRAA